MPDLLPLAEFFANIIRAWIWGLKEQRIIYASPTPTPPPEDLSNFQNIYVFVYIIVMDWILSLQNLYVEAYPPMKLHLETETLTK